MNGTKEHSAHLVGREALAEALYQFGLVAGATALGAGAHVLREKAETVADAIFAGAPREEREP